LVERHPAVLRVIEIAKSVPEELNDRKRQQLRELAALNGYVAPRNGCWR